MSKPAERIEQKEFFCCMCREFTETQFYKGDDGWDKIKCLECGYVKQWDWYFSSCPECGADTVEQETYEVCTLQIENKPCKHIGEIAHSTSTHDSFPWESDEVPQSPCKECDCKETVEEKGTLLEIKDRRYSQWAAMEFGGTPHNWTEVHKCWNCGNVYEFVNSDY